MKLSLSLIFLFFSQLKIIVLNINSNIRMPFYKSFVEENTIGYILIIYKIIGVIVQEAEAVALNVKNPDTVVFNVVPYNVL